MLLPIADVTPFDGTGTVLYYLIYGTYLNTIACLTCVPNLLTKAREATIINLKLRTYRTYGTGSHLPYLPLGWHQHSKCLGFGTLV